MASVLGVNFGPTQPPQAILTAPRGLALLGRPSESRLMTELRHAYICDAVRTPIGRFGGGLAYVRTDDLAAVPIMALMARNTDADWGALDEVILGCANQAGEDNRNVARMAAL